MMRIGHVFEQVTAFASLRDAACRALRANRESGGALRFHFDLEPRLLELQRQLLDGSYRPGPYRTFTIYEPKERRIAASPFRDRVVHHAVCAALEPVFERRYIFDSYGCRKNKGNQRAIGRAQRFAWGRARRGGAPHRRLRRVRGDLRPGERRLHRVWASAPGAASPGNHRLVPLPLYRLKKV